jgi:hypothetical protein
MEGKPMKDKRAFTSQEVPLSLRWRFDDSGGQTFRVWRNNWRGDQFEVMGITAFNEISRVCKMFSIPFLNYNNED